MELRFDENTLFQSRAYSVFDQSTGVVLLWQTSRCGVRSVGFNDGDVDYMLGMSAFLKALKACGVAGNKYFDRADFEMIDSLLEEVDSTLEEFGFYGVAVERVVEKLSKCYLFLTRIKLKKRKDYGAMLLSGELTFDEVMGSVEKDLAFLLAKLSYPAKKPKNYKMKLALEEVQAAVDELLVLSLVSSN